MKAEEKSQNHVEPLLLTARQICDLGILPFAIRTIRRMHASGKLPQGVAVGGKKCWRLTVLQRWVEMGCPCRREFEARMGEEARRA